MQWPLEKSQFWISQGFIGGHLANDLAANDGTPILSPDDGVVIAVNNNPAAYFGGNYIKIKGKSGYDFYMGHNRKNYFKLGDAVKKGQHIADVGSTGQSTGPHIHFEMSRGGKMYNPSSVLTKYPSKEVKMQTTALNRLYRAMLNRDATDADRKKYLGTDPNEAIIEIDNWARANGRTYQQTVAARDRDIATLKSDATKRNKEITNLKSENATLKKQLAEAQKNNGSFSDSDRATLIETNSLIKKITEWFKQIFNVKG